jgi:glycosyltransferase involved in cell wall biosynthesis
MHFKKLTIVSDTALYEKEGRYYGFGPVVRELEEIDAYFDEIIWIGFLREDKIDDLSMQVIHSKKIKPVFLSNVGGKNLVSFLGILVQYPKMLFTIIKHIRTADIVHTRAPSHPALIGGLLSFFFKQKIWWNKFAGNWAQIHPPKSYGFQRWLFEKARHTNVTLNGFWPNQLSHCHSFENPCLTQLDISTGIETVAKKDYSGAFILSFIGRLEDAKGVARIIEVLKAVDLDKIEHVHFVGDGAKTASYHQLASFLGDKVTFHGFLGKEKIHQILAESHFFLLPSTASEGFPKVIAEAACYGAIPIVSDVSSIGHYINTSNGFVWPIRAKIPFKEVLLAALQVDPLALKEKAVNVGLVAKMFTFENYRNKLEKFVFAHSKS